MATSRIPFEKLTPIHPNRRITLETGPAPIAPRLIDLFVPIGFGHRALVVLGINHVKKSGHRDADTTTRVASRYPGSTYVVLLDNGGLLEPAAQELVRLCRFSRNAPLLCELAGTPLGDSAHLGNEADALLYLGPPETLTHQFPPARSLEPTYMKELDRRSRIAWGELRARRLLGAAAE